MMTKQIDLGKSAEDAAAAYLTRRGYEVIARNWEARLRPMGFRGQARGRRIGEIDIVARKSGAFIFVEVKAGLSSEALGAKEEHYIDPSVHITPKKEHKLRQLAALWLMQNGKEGSAHQIDVVVVRKRRSLSSEALGAKEDEFEIEHFERAIGG